MYKHEYEHVTRYTRFDYDESGTWYSLVFVFSDALNIMTTKNNNLYHTYEFEIWTLKIQSQTHLNFMRLVLLREKITLIPKLGPITASAKSKGSFG